MKKKTLFSDEIGTLIVFIIIFFGVIFGGISLCNKDSGSPVDQEKQDVMQSSRVQ